MRVYVKWANFTPKARFEITKLRSFAWKNSRGNNFKKNIHAQRVQMQSILNSLQMSFGGEICSSDVTMH